MIYRVVWKYKGQLYTEYKDIEETAYILDCLDKWSDFELVSITPYEA